MADYSTVFLISGVYNNLDQTKAMLASLSNQSYPSIKTIIIDDGSTDGTADWLRENHPDARVISGDGQLWWTGAMYLGVEAVQKIAHQGDFVLTMNNDCTFDPDYVETLVVTSERFGRAVVGSLAVDRDDRETIWDGGVQIDWPAGQFIGLGPAKVADLPAEADVLETIDTLSTKGTLYPIEVFELAGNFDVKHLPHYASDYEMACRAKRAGFQLLVSYQARVYNDTRRTGFGSQRHERLTWAEFWRLMFSRRSQVNILDHWQLVRLACPPRYRPINYLRAVGKFVHYLLHVPPLTALLWLVDKSGWSIASNDSSGSKISV